MDPLNPTQEPMQGAQPMEPAGKVVERDRPEVPESRAALVKEWEKTVTEAKEYWKPVFEQMRKDMAYAKGWQWGEQTREAAASNDRYVANITHRHIRQRVAALYAKNPRVVAKPRERIYFELWDGDTAVIDQAKLLLSQPMPAVPGMPMPGANPAMQRAQALLMDFEQGMQKKQQLNRIAKTIEILCQYFWNETHPTFKAQAKQLIVRVLTCGVGYVKVGFQRLMDRSPELTGKINDCVEHLAHMERLAADLADGEIFPDQAEMEELRLMAADLQARYDLILREGVVFDFPKTTQIIPDPAVVALKGFVGADWVAQEFLFTPKKVQEIYKVDVGQCYTKHDRAGVADKRRKKADMACVYEIYDAQSRLKYAICKGYPDFLQEPAAPSPELEQFYPFFTLSFNDLEDEDDVFPPSNVSLMRPMNNEYNRCREGLREHRQGSRPAWVAAAGAMKETDKDKLATHATHELLELEGVAPGTDVKTVLQPKPTATIEPAVYEVESVFVDTMRVVGDQEANLGGTSGATATEASIAETSRVSSIASNVDDLDDFLSDIARAMGQVLLLNMGVEQVKRIAGPGAVWPEMSAKDVAEEITLEIKAGSSGRPNKAAEIANFERLAPTLIQLPNINLRRIAEEAITRLDDGLDIDEFYQEGVPSIVAQNGARGPAMGMGPTAPDMQGPEGAANAPAGPRNQPGGQPGYPGGPQRMTREVP